MKNDLERAISRLKRLAPRFGRVRVAVLGDLMLDRYLWGTATRLSPEAAVPVVDFISQTDFPGGAANVAANLSSLGAKVQLFGVVGGHKTAQKKVVPDEAGAALGGKLRSAQIADAGVFPDPRRITTVKTRVIARRHQIVRIDHERRDALAPESEERLFRHLLASLKSIDVLVLSDYDKGLVTDSLAERALRACHQYKVPVFVKPKTSRLFAYHGAAAIVCNTKEAAGYVPDPIPNDKSIEDVGRKLLGQFGCAAAVITRGEHGMSLFSEGSPLAQHIAATSFEPTYARVGQSVLGSESTGRQVFDVTGAGDTVLSVLALAAAAGATLPDAAFLANAAAGVVVGKLGTATLTSSELLAALGELNS